MANYRQKSRPPAPIPAPIPAEETTQPTTQDGTSTQSINFIRTMLEATMGTFLYLRYIFPDDFFEPIELRKEVLPTPPSVTSGSINDAGEETMIIDDSQMAASQQVSKPLITKRVKGATLAGGSPAPEASEFLARLEGIIEAVSKEYLRSVILYVILDPDRPNQVLETVTFNFTYSKVGPSCILTRELENVNIGGTKSQSSAALMTQGQVYQTMKAVLRDFVKEAQDLPDLPGTFIQTRLHYVKTADRVERRCLNFKVFYTDNAPPEYHVPGFNKEPEKEGLVFGTHSKSEEPDSLAPHVLDTNSSGLSVQLASIAGHLRPRTDIDKLVDGGQRSLGAKQESFRRHLEVAEKRDVTWDAETSVMYQDDHDAVPLGREGNDGMLQPLPLSRVISEDGSDAEYKKHRASGHGERATDLSIVPKLKVWGNVESYIGTQEVSGIRARRSDSEETAVVPSSDGTQSGPQSLNVTGNLLHFTKPNHSDHSSGSNPEAGLISSDEHTDPSSQEYSKDKDSFRAAALPPLKPVKPKKARAPSTARSAILPKPPRAPRKPRAPADPSKKKPDAKPRAKAQPQKSSSDDNGKSSSTVKKPPKTPKATPRKKMPSTPATSSPDSDKTAADELDVPTSCGCGVDNDVGEMIACDGCDTWKHAVCMGLLRSGTMSDEAFHCVICKVTEMKPSQNVLVDAQGDLHSLCLLRRILFMSRKSKVLPAISELCAELHCSSADLHLLLNRLISENFLSSEKSHKNAAAKYTYIDTDDTRKMFASYFRPGGRKEREEVPALENLSQLLSSSQIPTSQVHESQFDNSQFSDSQSTIPENQASQFQKRQLFLPHQSQLEDSQAEDIEMAESSTQAQSRSIRLVNTPKRRNMAAIPETDPIETFNSTQPKTIGRGTLGMEIDDTIDDMPPPSYTGRQFDRKGKRKAGDAISTRPTARIRAATGMTFIDCPFVEI